MIWANFKGLRLNTNLKSLPRPQIRRIKHLAKIWCLSVFGRNGKYKVKLRTYCKFDETIPDSGEYYYWGEKTIYTYPHSMKSVRDLIDTFLHEYCHYLQPLFYKSKKKYTYSKHPQERQANRFANKYVGKCWAEIRGKI